MNETESIPSDNRNRGTFCGQTSAWLLRVLLVFALVTFVAAFIGTDGFFYLGLLGCFALAAVIGFPAAFILASVSLLRHEPCRRVAVISFWSSLPLSASIGYFALRYLNTPLRLFQ